MCERGVEGTGVVRCERRHGVESRRNLYVCVCVCVCVCMIDALLCVVLQAHFWISVQR